MVQPGDRDHDLGRAHPPQLRRTRTAGTYLAVDRALMEYNPSAVVVKGLDIGHTDPQQILPYGGQVRIDPAAERITVTY